VKNVLVVYDSTYGNTEKVAQAIAGAIASEATVEAKRVGEVALDAMGALDLLVVGSPTQGFRPTKAVMEFLKRLRSVGLKGMTVAAFDTRFDAAKLQSGALRLLVKTGGYAAPRINSDLQKAGGAPVVPPEGFFVEDTEGPIRPGELERAATWARSVLHAG
jgi:flavodoxin